MSAPTAREIIEIALRQKRHPKDEEAKARDEAAHIEFCLRQCGMLK